MAGHGPRPSGTYSVAASRVPSRTGIAARSLGMSHFLTMRHIVLPQAIRRVLPPLGNDFIAMLKDSSLLSAIGVGELTYWGKTKIGASANTFLGWNTVAFLYLILSLLLSLGVKWIESRTSNERR